MGNELNRLAVSATNHCLTGCVIGESRGLSVRVHGHRYLIARGKGHAVMHEYHERG